MKVLDLADTNSFSEVSKSALLLLFVNVGKLSILIPFPSPFESFSANRNFLQTNSELSETDDWCNRHIDISISLP